MTILTFLGTMDLASLTGGTVQSADGASFNYTTGNGLTVALTGTGLTYDGDGVLTGGTLTGMTVTLGANTLATWTGLSIAGTDYARYAFGQISGSAPTQPDATVLEAKLMAGADNIYGGEGDGFIYGRNGNDTLHGGNGDDWLYGGHGNDRYYGDAGTDGVTFITNLDANHGVSVDLTRLTGQVRNDGYGHIETATAVERWEGSTLNDTLIGGASYDTFWGAGGNDILRGGGNSDWLYGNAGNDSLYGDADTDLMIGGAGADYYDGGAGGDIVGLWIDEGTANGARLDLRLASGNILDDGFGNVETAVNVENFEGTALADWMHAGNAPTDQPVALRGMGGDDTLRGGDVWSVLNGNDGNDSLVGGAGNESLSGGAGVDTIRGGAGTDLVEMLLDTLGHVTGVRVDLTLASGQILDDGFGNVETATGIENLSLSNQADWARGSIGANVLYGNDGADTLYGMDGNDTIYGGNGNDTVYGGAGADDLWNDSGANRLAGGSGADRFEFTADATGAGKIADFTHGSDKLVLDFDFGATGSTGAVLDSQFLSGAGANAATTADQRLIYDSSTGKLYLDGDGTGTDLAPQLVAVLLNHAALSASDVEIAFL